MFIFYFAIIQFSTPDLPDNDGYYHIKMAYLMRMEGIKPDFPWLPLSILNQREFYDHHFLFHIALMPFTFGDLRLGAKWAAVLFASFAFMSTWNLLKKQRVPFAWLWAAGLMAVSEAFIYRMSITRAQSLSLAVLMLGFDWLLRKKYSHLAILAFVYVWLYNAFPLLMVVAGIFVLAEALVNQRWDIRPLLFIGLGTVLGLAINPYFPHNLVFAVRHILPKVLDATVVRVGNEWYPYETAQLLKNSPISLLTFVSGTLALGLSRKRMDLRTAVGFLLTCLFGYMLFQSRRFIEYFPAFSLVFAAFAWSPVLGELQPVEKAQRDDATNASMLSRARAKLSSIRQQGLLRNLPALLSIILLILGTWSTISAAMSSLSSAKPYMTYAGASTWLAANTPEGERVFQTDWDDFPRLFYYNTHNTYLIGLDPTYMQFYNADAYSLWVEITRGEIDRPSGLIEAVFGAHYVVTDLRHAGFLSAAADDPRMLEVYRDSHSVVFRVVSVDDET